MREQVAFVYGPSLKRPEISPRGICEYLKSRLSTFKQLMSLSKSDYREAQSNLSYILKARSLPL